MAAKTFQRKGTKEEEGGGSDEAMIANCLHWPVFAGSDQRGRGGGGDRARKRECWPHAENIVFLHML